MLLVDVLIQHGKSNLDRPFTYLYEGKKKVDVGFRVLVPFNGQTLMGFVLHVQETSKSREELEEENGFPYSFLISVVDEEALLTEELNTLAKEVKAYYLSPMISVLQTMLPPSLKPSYSALNKPKIAYEDYLVYIKDPEEKLTAKQREIFQLVKFNGEIRKKEAGSLSVIKALLEKGLIAKIQKERVRFVIPEYEKEQAHALSLEQQKAFDEILSSPKEVILLQGVTGSGKTEVYLHLSERYLSKGKNILMLVPEISLTPVMVEYFSRRFGKEIAILHSSLTPAEKYDEYRRIARGDARIVVGARSAVFAPLSNIGLIILDEEHVETYKQDTPPYYHAREVAIMRAKHFGAKVVLGSATPSFETKARARKGVYGLAELTKRVNQKPLPPVKIIDLRNSKDRMASDQVFSKELIGAIKNRLEKKEQVMLLVNRRGYCSFVTCCACGEALTCKTCGSNLTYHKEEGLLKCHHCGYVEDYPEVCPKCGSDKLKRVGFGTERAVKVLQEYFPDARIARMDTDVTRVRKAMEKTLSAFKAKEYDILVGTQMIAKGHDFPDVTLVGVLMADTGLLFPNYRASESTFQLIAQAVGRGGRASKQGEAMIQTYNPWHYAITLAAKQDYESFYRREMQERHLSHFPPYYYLSCLHLSGKDEERVAQAAYEIKMQILDQRFENVDSIGPMTPYYAIVGEMHKRTLLIKYRSSDRIKPFLDALLHDLDGKGGIGLSLDVDALDY